MLNEAKRGELLQKEQIAQRTAEHKDLIPGVVAKALEKRALSTRNELGKLIQEKQLIFKNQKKQKENKHP